MSTVTNAPPAPPTPTPHQRPHVRRLPLVLVIGAIVGGLLGLLIAPGAPDPGHWRGDPGLSARLTDALRGERGIYSMSVAEIDRGSTRRADLGPVGGHHELGSVTKTFTGQLFADAITRGEVRPSDRLGDRLPELAGTPVGDVTLEELAGHRGGVPPLIPAELLAGLRMPIALNDPYSATTAEVLTAAAQIELTDRGSYAYSNLGAALLGHALARAANQPDWETLVRQRLLQPLGMTGVVFATRPELIPADASTGRTANGNRPEPWTAEGMAPAGTSTYVTVDDLAKYARALLDGTAPGMAALDPRLDADSPTIRIGYFWITTAKPGQPAVTWHNGGTGGARTFFGLDRANQRAVIVLNDSTVSVDSLGAGLLTGSPVDPAPFPIVPLVVLLLAVGAVGVLVLRVARAGSRLPLVSAALDSVLLLIISRQLGPWQLVPGLLWTALAGIALPAALWGVRRFPGLPWVGRKRVTDWTALVISVLLLGGLTALLLF